MYCLLFLTLGLAAQDAYHTNLQAGLMNDFGLPEGEFLISDTETGFLAAAYNWGSNRLDLTIPEQDFSRSSVITVEQAGSNPWDAGFFAQNGSGVTQGDKLLWVFSIRSVGGTNGDVNLVVEETQSGSFMKELFLPVDISQEWTTYAVAVEIQLGDRPAGGLQIGFHCGSAAQTLEIGGFAVINYEDQVELEDLPSDISAESYDGSAVDAPWRSVAQDRIETLRKADLTINTRNSQGEAVPGVALEVNMIQHEFAFGTAIKGCRFPGNDCSNAEFRENLLNLDGNGHGFNWVVYENDLKWDAWEENWFGSNEEIASSVQYLVDRGIKVRGHVLLWPGWNNMPDDMQANASDEPYLVNRTLEHLENILNYPGIDGNVADWDVINETVTNTDLANALAGEPGYTTGREFYAEVFEQAQLHAPEAKLYYNDFSTITLGQDAGDASYETKRLHIQEMVDAGAPVDGIGFQAHVGSFPNGIPAVIETYDDFYDQFGLDQKITEFDMPPNVSEELGAQYMIDFMTATFSHPSMNGFLFWNFWDGDTWMNPGSNLFDLNWNRTPAGDAYVATVFDDWWTSESTESDADGNADIRGFKGQYEITYVCNGETIKDTINMTEDLAVTLNCDEFLLDVDDNQFDRLFTVGPNPTSGALRVEHPFGEATQAVLFSSLGQKVWEGQLPNRVSNLIFDLPGGTYTLQLTDGGRRANRKVIIW